MLVQVLCPWKGREDKQSSKTKGSEERQIPTVTVDYGFIGKDDAKPLTVLAVNDLKSNALEVFDAGGKGSGDGKVVAKKKSKKKNKNNVQKLIGER